LIKQRCSRFILKLWLGSLSSLQGGFPVRFAVIAFILTTLASAQTAFTTTGNANKASEKKSEQLVIPAGTKVPLSLKHAISTKETREGDGVYAETTFPIVLNDRVLIPAGTFVQGRISHIQRAGRIKGRAEVLMHFTTLIYPSGYTVMLPGALENAPGVDKTNIKGNEGTIRGDSQTAEKVGTAASTAATGAVIGAVTNGGKGAAIGAGIGGATGAVIALLTRGNDVKLDAGTTLEMVIQRDVPVDPSRVPPLTRTSVPTQ
jgi:type IV secretory pathway VirB10-like protein